MATDRLTWNYTSPTIRFVLEADYMGYSIEGNYSILDCWIRCVNVGGTSTFSNNTGNHWGSVDGVGQFAHHYASPWLPSGYGTNAVRWRKGGTVHVPHNTDGTRGAAVVRMRVAYGRSAGNIDNTDTYSISLPTIPRATTPEFKIGSTVVTEFDANAALTINLPRASSNFTHDITYNFQGATGTIATGAGVSASWTPPYSLLNQIPNANQAVGSITVVTKSGATTIGTKTLNFTLKAPAASNPTLSAPTLFDFNETVRTQIGGYVKGKSELQVTVNASAKHGASIQESSFSIDGASGDSGNIVPLNNSGTRSLGYSAKDTRQRLVSSSMNITVLNYSEPNISNFIVERVTSDGTPHANGTYLKVTLNSSVSSLVVSTQKNSHTIRVYTRLRGTTDWGSAKHTISQGTTLTYNSNFILASGGVYATANAYEVRVDVVDKLATESDTTVVATSGAIVDATPTKQAFGKLVEETGPPTQIQGPARVYGGGLETDGEVLTRGTVVAKPVGEVFEFPVGPIPSGCLELNGQAVSRVTYAELFALWGTTFGAGNGSSTFNVQNRKGLGPMGLDSAQTEFNTITKTGGAKTHTLTEAEMPSHNHSASTNSTGAHTHSVPNVTNPGSGSGGTIESWGGGSGSRTINTGSAGAHSHTVTVGSKGGGGAHNNLQPYYVTRWVVQAK